MSVLTPIVKPNIILLDDDSFSADAANAAASQQSTKAYIAAQIAAAIAGGVKYKGNYDAATNTPNLDVAASGVLVGDLFVVSVAGVFFSANVEIGDSLISEIDDPTTEADWLIVQTNLDAASIKALYEGNADTNALTDALLGKLNGLTHANYVQKDGSTPITGDQTFAAKIISNGTTEATSTTAAEIQTDGGIACVKDLIVGGDATVSGDITSDGAYVSNYIKLHSDVNSYYLNQNASGSNSSNYIKTAPAVQLHASSSPVKFDFKTAPSGTAGNPITWTTRMKVDTGGVDVIGLLDLSAATSGQLKFPAAQNASADANTLDDYEKGISTVGVADSSLDSGEGQTYSNNTLYYTKIGRRVFFDFDITITSMGTLNTGQSIRFIGLPFLSQNTSNKNCPITIGDTANVTILAGESIAGYIPPNSTHIEIVLWSATTGTTFPLVSIFSATTSVSVSGHYDI